MTITITHSLSFVGDLDPSLIAGTIAADSLTDGGFVVVGTNAGGSTQGITYNPAAVPDGGFGGFVVGDPDVAGLTNGNFVAVGTDGSNVFYTLRNGTGGGPIGPISLGDSGSSNAQVTGLQGGGFAIVTQDTGFLVGDNIDLRIYDAVGTLQTTVAVISGFPEDVTPCITTLENGHIALAWVRVVGINTQIWTAVYTATGGVVTAPFLLDSAGSVNANPQIVTTRTGYGILYEDNGWATGSTDITLARMTDSGTFLGLTNVSNPTFVTNGTDRNVSVAALPGGSLAVGFENNGFGDYDLRVVVLSDTGEPGSMTSFGITGGYPVTNAQGDSAVAYFGDSQIALFGTDFNASDGVGGTFTLRRTLTSDAQDDILLGSAVREIFVGSGGAAGDTAAYLDAAAGVTANLAAGTGTGGDAAGDAYVQITGLWGSAHADDLTGNGWNNYLKGAAGADTLNGGGGDDTLDGGLGIDRMEGGTGNDRYLVDEAGDVIAGEIGFSLGGGIDTVESFVSFSLTSNLEILRLQGNADLNGFGNAAPESIVGNTGQNTLGGGGGNDTLNGKEGQDRLIGGAGRDLLIGEAGNDTFVYTAATESGVGASARDFINGFVHGQDRIDLAGIDANSLTGANDAFTFIGSTAFAGTGAASAGQLRFFTFGGLNVAIVEADRNGDGAADMQIFVNLTNVMAAGDFVL